MENERLLLEMESMLNRKLKSELSPIKQDIHELKDDVRVLKGDVSVLKDMRGTESNVMNKDLMLEEERNRLIRLIAEGI